MAVGVTKTDFALRATPEQILFWSSVDTNFETVSQDCALITVIGLGGPLLRLIKGLDFCDFIVLKSLLALNSIAAALVLAISGFVQDTQNPRTPEICKYALRHHRDIARFTWHIGRTQIFLGKCKLSHAYILLTLAYRQLTTNKKKKV